MTWCWRARAWPTPTTAACRSASGPAAGCCASPSRTSRFATSTSIRLIFNGGTAAAAGLQRAPARRAASSSSSRIPTAPAAASTAASSSTRCSNTPRMARSDYTNGVDVHTGANWIIRHNLFRRIRSAQGLAGPAVLMWNNSRDTIVDGNTFVDCHRDISLGLIPRTPNDHTGGVDPQQHDRALARRRRRRRHRGVRLARHPRGAQHDLDGRRVLRTPSSTASPTPTGLTIANNLADTAVPPRATARHGHADRQRVDRRPPATSSAPATGNLHLAAAAAAAIDKVTAAPTRLLDWDGEARPAGAVPTWGRRARPSQNRRLRPSKSAATASTTTATARSTKAARRASPSARVRPSRSPASVQGSTVALTWLAPIAGGRRGGLRARCGVRPGQHGQQPGRSARTRSISLPGVGPGTYFLRVRATGAARRQRALERSGGHRGRLRQCAARAPRAHRRAPTARWSRSRGSTTTAAKAAATACSSGRQSGVADLGAVPVTGSPLSGDGASGSILRARRHRDEPAASAHRRTRWRSPPPASAARPRSQWRWRAAPRLGVLDLHWQPTDVPTAETADAATPLAYVSRPGARRGSVDLGVFPIGRTDRACRCRRAAGPVLPARASHERVRVGPCLERSRGLVPGGLSPLK